MKVSIVPWIVKKLKTCLALVEDGNTATQNIAKGKYVIWKGVMCKAASAISSGDTLSNTNLTAVSGGVANECVTIDTYNSMATDYMTLLGRTALTTSYVTVSTYNNRKISDYTDLLFVFYRGIWVFGTVFCVRSIFTNVDGVYYVTRAGTTGEFIECDVKYVDDTHFSIKKITSDTTEIAVGVYALCNKNI